MYNKLQGVQGLTRHDGDLSISRVSQSSRSKHIIMKAGIYARLVMTPYCSAWNVKVLIVQACYHEVSVLATSYRNFYRARLHMIFKMTANLQTAKPLGRSIKIRVATCINMTH